MTNKDTPSENSSPLDDLTTAYRTLFVDLPLAEARWWVGLGSEQEVIKAVWTEYDALAHLASSAFEPLLRIQRSGLTRQNQRQKSLPQQKILRHEQSLLGERPEAILVGVLTCSTVERSNAACWPFSPGVDSRWSRVELSR